MDVSSLCNDIDSTIISLNSSIDVDVATCCEVDMSAIIGVNCCIDINVATCVEVDAEISAQSALISRVNVASGGINVNSGSCLDGVVDVDVGMGIQCDFSRGVNAAICADAACARYERDAAIKCAESFLRGDGIASLKVEVALACGANA